MVGRGTSDGYIQKYDLTDLCNDFCGGYIQYDTYIYIRIYIHIYIYTYIYAYIYAKIIYPVLGVAQAPLS